MNRQPSAKNSNKNQYHTIAGGKWHSGQEPSKNEWYLAISNGGSGNNPPQFAIQAGGTKYTAGGTPLPVGSWYHLVGVREGDYIKLYVDGTLVDTEYVGAAVVNTVPTRNIYLGLMGNGKFLKAGFDEFVVYHRALNATEVDELYGLGCGDFESEEVVLASGGYRYGFNGMEKDDEIKGSGNSYSFKYRIYDSRLGKFLSVDPLAHQFPWQSPYNGFNDNPINLIDPDGRAAMPPDDYSVDKDGNLKLEQKTDDDFDMLYTKSDYDQGNTQNGLKINDQSILPSLKEGNYGTAKATVGESSTDDLYATFMFLANKTASEWAVYQTSTNNEKQFTLGTLYEKGFSPSPTNLSLNKDDVLSMVHSHPGADLSTEMSSMGYWQSNNQLQARGDWYIVRNNLQEGRKQSYFYYTYFPKSGNLYHVEKSAPRYIRNIQNNPKRFFFGTMR